VPLIRLDPHGHLYDAYSLEEWVNAALLNLMPEDEIEAAVIIVDRCGQDSFARIKNEVKPFGAWEVAQFDSAGQAIVGSIGYQGRRLNIIRGVQYVSSEKIEVLAFGISRTQDDGSLSCRELISEIKSLGGVACLPWAPGKWLGSRGQVISEILANSSPNNFLLGDIAIRPRLILPSAVLNRGETAGFKVLCGTDPLPRPEDVNIVGSYGIEFESSRGFKDGVSVKEILAVIASAHGFKRVWGKPNTPFKALRRFISSL
jgi:hypothetical protein